jgi:hypothetical protein
MGSKWVVSGGPVEAYNFPTTEPATSLADRLPPGPGTRPALCSHGKLMPHGYFSHVNALRELTTVKSEANDVCVNHFNLYVRKLGNTMLGLRV